VLDLHFFLYFFF
jgi:hypothetical protein